MQNFSKCFRKQLKLLPVIVSYYGNLIATAQQTTLIGVSNIFNYISYIVFRNVRVNRYSLLLS